MKKSPSPNLHQSSSKRKQKSNLQDSIGYGTNRSNSKPHPTLKSFKSAVKKFAAVFSLILSGKRKTASEVIGSDDRNNTAKVRGVLSSSTSVSSGSNNKSSSKWKFSYSYPSASTATTSEQQLGIVNFSFEEIYKSTAKFSPDNQIGEGGFGTVYKGKLSDGSLVAVKRAKKDVLHSHLFEFKNEINTLSKIEHMNLVRLYGYLEHGDEKMIIIEYVGNGTLREHLNGIRGDGLEIGERLDIAIDVAHAVTYLHMYTDNPIIHRDIKASNILITDNFRAKVADFGFARLSDDPGATHISTQVKGTAGYMDPEYLRTYQLTEKSDVYSFGVLLVEMITGRNPIEQKRPPNERVTIRWAMQMVRKGDVVFAMDPRLRRSPASIDAVKKVLKLASQCLASLRESRPSMKKCAEVLWGIRKSFRDEAIPHPPLPSHLSENFPQREKNKHMSFGIEDDDSYKFASAPNPIHL
ncbi:calmodulin-binding receptor-like cytoplasmic kinase 2 [Lotus japonicus]|uniref:non-specific serine/threonine protein kinase n=1 Tax=Lotus japonicus TaxID=34305 RepID=I3RZW0_LOTJA|nr:calmodulin-binding receptor-like cytoplasmic kinase 2 [Lotus japonicus]AFK33552.1 unknown [Lotus japonicus]